MFHSFCQGRSVSASRPQNEIHTHIVDFTCRGSISYSIWNHNMRHTHWSTNTHITHTHLWNVSCFVRVHDMKAFLVDKILIYSIQSTEFSTIISQTEAALFSLFYLKMIIRSQSRHYSRGHWRKPWRYVVHCNLLRLKSWHQIIQYNNETFCDADC